MKYTSGRYTSGQLMDNIFEVEDALTRKALAGSALAITDESLQSDFKSRIEDLSMGLNTVLFDANDKPSVYTVYKPDEKARLDYLANGGTHFVHTGNEVHPAFIVNGAVVELLIGKYPAGRVAGTNHAVSLRGLDPANTINYDNSLAACVAKGPGHHMVTQAEWAYLYLLAIREGFQPRGNDNYGKSYQDATEKGIGSYIYSTNGAVIGRTRTGSGPIGWHLDGTPFSPADLRGNVVEWLAGYRTNEGEVNVLQDNNAADGTKDQSAVSTLWKAMLQDGSLVAPGTADTLKWDFVAAAPASGSAAYQLNIALDNPPADATPYGVNTFSTLAAKAGVTVPTLARILGIMPPLANAPLGTQYMRNVGERLGFAGGGWFGTSVAGLGYRDAYNERTLSYNSVGFRPAFYRALTA
jgi:hypothetical protein